MLNLQNYEQMSPSEELFGNYFSFSGFTKFLMGTECENNENEG